MSLTTLATTSTNFPISSFNLLEQHESDALFFVLSNIPHELLYRIFEQVITINLTTLQICKLIALNDAKLNTIISSILLNNCSLEIVATKGVQFISGGNDGHHKSKLDFMPFQSSELTVLVNFMTTRNIKFNKIILTNVRDCFLKIVSDLRFQTLLTTCCHELDAHVFDICYSVVPHLSYLSRASSITLPGSVILPDLLASKPKELKHLTLSLPSDTKTITKVFIKLKSWFSEYYPFNVKKKLTLKLVPDKPVSNIVAQMLESLPLRKNIDLELHLICSGYKILKSLTSLKHYVTKLKYTIDYQELCLDWLADWDHLISLKLCWFKPVPYMMSDPSYNLSTFAFIPLVNSSIEQLYLENVPENIHLFTDQLPKLLSLDAEMCCLSKSFFNNLSKNLKLLKMNECELTRITKYHKLA
ncbi:unnamed protein product [Ambrosiozyma monospora]|uniref:Unnamed protein product n=1 Tax=Ambrosiozyma monospora TaxID=43982 RepID=A0ACB5TCP0_AMBMO|nr:unnamed protein product [Ambrosiozyma monospora]